MVFDAGTTSYFAVNIHGLYIEQDIHRVFTEQHSMNTEAVWYFRVLL